MPKTYGSPANSSEWPYLIDADDIGSEPKTFKFRAGKQERVDIARRLGIPSIEEAAAVITVQRSGALYHAIGTVKARVTQSCTISLAPVPAEIEDEFDAWYGDKSKAVSFAKARSEREAKKTHMEAEILEESVDPEPIVNGKIDLGELAIQYLSLSLDPYPRAEGVSHVFEAKPEGGDDTGKSARKSPFDALKDWKEKR